MRKSTKIIWGIALIILGIVFILNILNITNINFFFKGWWTLFIIIPHFIGLFTEREKFGNAFGLVIGVLLLLCCRDILSFRLLLKLIIPIIIIFIGAKLLIGSIFGGKASKLTSSLKEKGKFPKEKCAAFSSVKLECDGEEVEWLELTAAFGRVECDLRNSLINKNCIIKVTSLFGSIEILVPENANVKVETTGIFGGVSNKTQRKKDVSTIYVNGLCMFGGVEIK